MPVKERLGLSAESVATQPGKKSEEDQRLMMMTVIVDYFVWKDGND